jgi:hypothetical protein
MDLIFSRKTLTGWWLSNWFKTTKPEDIGKWKKFIQDDYEKDGGIFSTSFDQAFKLEDFEKAFELYNVQGKKPVFKM